MRVCREGVSGWGRAFERGTHGEVFGYAGGRNKGEGDGWATSGDMEVYSGAISNLKNKEGRQGCYTIFFDNLPSQVLKGELFKEVWSAGRAVARMNGKWWKGKSIHANISRFKRNEGIHVHGAERGHGRAGITRSMAVRRKLKRWVPTGRIIDWPGTVGGKDKSIVGRKDDVENRSGKDERKELTLKPSTLQCEILARSLLGRVKCKDVGPFRCLVTFESETIRDEALSNQILMNVFDEIRHHWGLVWSFSRRVWVEVMWLPTIVWSEETFKSIAKLWGKVKVDEWEFEIFVKEFGAAVYSRESHQNEAELAYMGETESQGAIRSLSLIEETPTVVQDEAATGGDDGGGNLNNVDVNTVDDFENHGERTNEVNDDGSLGVKETRHEGEVAGRRRDRDEWFGMKVWASLEEVSPVVDLGLVDKFDPTYNVDGGNWADSHKTAGIQCPSSSPSDTDSCPYPPGFGSCTNSAHAHGTVGDQSDPEDKGSESEGAECDMTTVGKNPNGVPLNTSDDVDGVVLEEAIKIKQLCEVGGLSFKSGESKELLRTIVGINLGKKAKCKTPSFCNSFLKRRFCPKRI
ncbi:hypothetical protein PIB30_070603 [Stylosanthes scabra]|uniref:DUF4283 domain-containing protein n=1 Tax=Stylosanthes scabra TaxID=79078 RepID=A0ABU6SNL2_9FABA|nr:hypothetical protein [Stylosanthes scabra]